MATEEVANGFKLSCDTSGCSATILAPCEADAMEEASLIGWKLRSGHVCVDCAQGVLPEATAFETAKARVGLPSMQTLVPVKAGDPLRGPDGCVVGNASHDGAPGDVVSFEPTGELRAEFIKLAGVFVRPSDESEKEQRAELDEELSNLDDLLSASSTTWEPE